MKRGCIINEERQEETTFIYSLTGQKVTQYMFRMPITSAETINIAGAVSNDEKYVYVLNMEQALINKLIIFFLNFNEFGHTN